MSLSGSFTSTQINESAHPLGKAPQNRVGEISQLSLLEKGRRSWTEKLGKFHVLRGRGFWTLQESFCWILHNAVEFRCRRRTVFLDELFINKTNASSLEEECAEVLGQNVESNYDYEAHSFMGVWAKHTSNNLCIDNIGFLQSRCAGMILVTIVIVFTVAFLCITYHVIPVLKVRKEVQVSLGRSIVCFLNTSFKPTQ